MLQPGRVKFITAVATTAFAAALAAFSTFAIVDAVVGPDPSDSLLVSLAHAHETPPLQAITVR